MLDGHVIIEGLLSADAVAAARAELQPLLDATPFGTNSFVGRRTKRVFGLPAKTRALDGALTHPRVLAALEPVLGPFLLSTTVAVEIHPGETAQTLHTDGSAWPVPAGGPEIVANAIWALDDFTEANGATRFEDDVAEMPAGSVLLYVGSSPHGGGANVSDAPRLGVIVGYTAAWLRQQENFTLTCPPDVARTMPERLQRLLGYELYPPFVGHADGHDPMDLLR
ncbi:MAG: phytanoyl-CoA dioxygenase family protein [Actinomycetia bacterium]|nr:phytanoyl-CoA dioxygenase family protein [Actinomycetes bacterium]